MPLGNRTPRRQPDASSSTTSAEVPGVPGKRGPLGPRKGVGLHVGDLVTSEAATAFGARTSERYLNGVTDMLEDIAFPPRANVRRPRRGGNGTDTNGTATVGNNESSSAMEGDQGEPWEDGMGGNGTIVPMLPVVHVDELRDLRSKPGAHNHEKRMRRHRIERAKQERELALMFIEAHSKVSSLLKTGVRSKEIYGMVIDKIMNFMPEILQKVRSVSLGSNANGCKRTLCVGPSVHSLSFIVETASVSISSKQNMLQLNMRLELTPIPIRTPVHNSAHYPCGPVRPFFVTLVPSSPVSPVHSVLSLFLLPVALFLLFAVS